LSESTPATGSATWHFAANHPAADGHFPGNPIIPGAVLLRDIIAAIRHATTRGLSYIPSAKFHHVVRPDDTLIISWVLKSDTEIRFTCSIAETGRKAVTGELRVAAP
jgi:3-hydroxyacyl-[acyl-carrier-protein] dehydratase